MEASSSGWVSLHSVLKSQTAYLRRPSSNGSLVSRQLDRFLHNQYGEGERGADWTHQFENQLDVS
jgi:hypothetical protein